MNFFKALLNLKFPEPKKVLFYFSLGFILSGIQFLTHFYSNPPAPGYLTILKGDVIEYLGLAENVIQHGVYGSGKEPMITRMPGFSIFYLPFRIFLDPRNAINALVIFQLIFSVVSKYFFSRIIFEKTGSSALFLLSYSLLVVGAPLIFYNNILYTESLASSCLMMMLFLLHRFNSTDKQKFLLYAGLFLALMIFYFIRSQDPFERMMFAIVFALIIFMIPILRNHESRFILITHGLFVYAVIMSLNLVKYKKIAIALVCLVSIVVSLLTVVKMY